MHVAIYIAIHIATKLYFADFEPCTVARYLATRADYRPNLTTVCLSLSPTDTGLQANISVFIYLCKFIIIRIIPFLNISVAQLAIYLAIVSTTIGIAM